MSFLFGGNSNNTPQTEFGAKVNQSVIGYCVPWGMGTFQAQQSLFWMDGWVATQNSTGGKGGKSGPSFYIYTVNVVAGLCIGPVTAVGDVWTGQSWLGNPAADESYTVMGSGVYTPTQSPNNDQGVGLQNSYSGTYNDAGAPTSNSISGTDYSPMQKVDYTSVYLAGTMAAGQYAMDSSGVYYFNPNAIGGGGSYGTGQAGNGGQAVQVSYSFNKTQITEQETDIVPSSGLIQVGGTFTYGADYSVTYAAGANEGHALTRVNGSPTVAGTYQVTGSGPASYRFYTAGGAGGDVGNEVTITFGILDNAAVGQGEPTLLSFELNNGSLNQTPYSFLTASYPQAGTSYCGVATVLYQPMDMGSSNEVQQNKFEVVGPDVYGSGIEDCNPVQCIYNVLTNSQTGLGVGNNPFPVSCIDNGPAGTWGNSTASAQAIVDLKSAAAASGGNTVYTVAIVQSGLLIPSALVGMQFKIAGFSHSANNGTFTVVSNTNITVTFNNASGVAETGASATATPVQGQRTANSSAWNWCAANNMFISPFMDSQDTAASWMSKWLEAARVYGYCSEGLFKLFAEGDTTTAANGVTWTAPQSYVVALDDTCFLRAKENEDPVKITRKSRQDAWNTVQIQWNNRAKQYCSEITSEYDQALIDLYAPRIEDPQDCDYIHSLAAATFAANTRLKHGTDILITFEFSLPDIYSYLEPGDLATLTTSSSWATTNNVNLNCVKRPVRILKVVDNPNKDGLQLTAEDYPYGAHLPTIYNKQISAGTTPVNLFAYPGSSEVVMVEASSQLTGYDGWEIWIGANGQSNTYGTTNVFVSVNGGDYEMIGTVNSQGRLGVLDSTFATGSDPDTVNSLVVDLADNCPALDPATSTDADNHVTLLFVDGEIVSYSASTVTGQNQYTLGTYLRRGLYGTPITSHSAGGLVLRLDNTVLKYQYPPQWIGQTLLFKFQAVNAFGNNPQDLSSLTPVSFTITGSGSGTIDQSTGLIIGAAAGQGECPVSTTSTVTNSLTSGALTSAWTAGNAIVQPGTVEFDVFSTGGLVDVLLWASNTSSKPNGYMLRFDGRSGFVAGQVLIVTAGNWGNIDTPKAPANSGALMGWHHVKAQIGNSQMDVFVDGVYCATAVDRTYAPTGATYYGYEVTAGASIGPTGMVTKTQDQLPDGTTYARVVGTALTSGSVDPTKTGVLMKGSVPPSINGGLTYTSTTSSITWSWPANTAVYRADGTITLIGAGTQAITGLTVNKSYAFYPVYDEATQALKFIGASDVTFPSVVGYTGDGSTGYVSTTTSVSQPGNFSVECWINTTSSAVQPLFDLSAPQVIGTAGNKSFSMWFQNSTVSAFALLGSSVITSIANVSATTKLNDGNTHHIVLTWDNTAHACTVYVDGVLQTNGSSPASAFTALSTMFWHIGGVNGKASWTLTSNTFATAAISNAAFYNAVLSATRVSNHYQAMLNISVAQYNTLVAADAPIYWWKLNETSGTSAADSAGSNTGTYQGTVTLNVSNPAYGADGSPAIAWAATSYLTAQAANLQGYIPLTSGSIMATAASGGSGGGGGIGGGMGGGGCFSPNTLVKTDRGDVRFDEITLDDKVLTAAGTWRPIAKILVHDWDKPMLSMGDEELITYLHRVKDDQHWLRGMQVFGGSQPYEGVVMNLEVKTDEPEQLCFSPQSEHSYTLANGNVVHNGPVGDK